MIGAFSTFWRRRENLIALLLVTVTMALFAPSIWNGFVYDDGVYVVENANVHSGLTTDNLAWAATGIRGSNWHPLTWISLQLDAQLYGLNPAGYHFTNVLLHALNSLLLFRVLWRMTGALGRSCLVALLFAVHPLRVESVAWVTERKDVLSTFFWMLTLHAYVSYVSAPTWPRYVAVFLWYCLGLMAKPMLVTLPFVLLLLDFWPLGRCPVDISLPTHSPAAARQQLPWLRLLWEKAPLLVPTIACCWVTLVAQVGAISSVQQISYRERLANCLVGYGAYLYKLVWPLDLAVLYPLPQRGWPVWIVVGAILVILAVSSLAWQERVRHPYLLVGWLWYVGTLVPVIGIVQVGIQAFADRYTYIPLIGISLMLVWGGHDLASAWRVHVAVPVSLGAGCLIACLVLTRMQIRSWYDNSSLWSQAAQAADQSADTHYNLGTDYLGKGALDKAIQEFREAIRIRPSFASAHLNLGVALSQRGELDEASQCYTRAVRLKKATNKPSVNPSYNLGVLYRKQGQFAAAILQCRSASAIDRRFADAHNNLGEILQHQGQLDAAVACFQEAASLAPKSVRFHCNLAGALLEQGRTTAAEAEFAAAAQLDPKWQEATNELAWRLATSPLAYQRDGFLAVQFARPVCQATQFQDPAYLDSLAAAYAEAAQFDKAVATGELAQRLANDTGKTDLGRQIEQRLRGYQKREPFHFPATADGKP